MVHVFVCIALSGARSEASSETATTRQQEIVRAAAAAAAAQHTGGGSTQPATIPLVFSGVFSSAANASSSSHSDAFTELARVAVLSALRNTHLRPVYFILGGDERAGADSAHTQWLRAQGVTVIRHTPKWHDTLIVALAHARAKGLDKRYSHLYSDASKLLGTFLRVDVPLLPALRAYPLVLYADVDTLFVRAVSLSEFGQREPGSGTPPMAPPPPSRNEHRLPPAGSRRVPPTVPFPPPYFTVGTEIDPALATDGHGRYRGSAGVMLMNVESLRATHAQFVEWIFKEEHVESGMHFGSYGPVDQGAYMAFYQRLFPVIKWPSFNWKPYWGANPSASIVHFNGPKALDYLQHRRQCAAGLCTSASGSGPSRALLGYCHRMAGCYDYAEQWRNLSSTSGSVKR